MHKKKNKVPSRNILQIIFHNAQVLDITGPLEVFSQANNYLSTKFNLEQPAYNIWTVSEREGSVEMSSGLELLSDFSFHSFQERNRGRCIDTLLVGGGRGVFEGLHHKDLIEFLAREGSKARRLASICTATFLLAKAGFLSGKKATTHWSECERLAREYPDIRVEPDKIFIKSGNIYSSAGVTAGIDLALAMVEDDFGRETALYVAKMLVVFTNRQGGQSQYSSNLTQQYATNGAFQDTLDWARENLEKDLSVQALAERSAMSERNFARMFKKQVGVSPGKYVEKMRVEFASQQIEISYNTLQEIAMVCGFTSEESMRNAFKRHLNILPNVYRKRFGR